MSAMVPQRHGWPSRRASRELLPLPGRAEPAAVHTIPSAADLVITALNVLSLTEQLLEEALYQLRVMRPVVVDVGMVHRTWHLDPLFSTVDQIQKSAGAIFVWPPIAVVRSVIGTDRAVQESEPTPPADPDGPVHQLIAFGGRVVDRAERLLPGALPRQMLERVLGGARQTDTPYEKARHTVQESTTRGATGGVGRGGIEVRFDPITLAVPRIALRTPSVSVRIPSVGVVIPATDLRLPGWPRARRY